MPYEIENDPYIDQESGILRNLLGVRTQKELDSAEARLTSLEITALTSEDAAPYEELTADAFTDVHKRLFKDIYDWAGTVRTVEISKGETSFARAAHLETSMRSVFSNLKEEGYLEGLDTGSFVKRLAHYYGDLIALHPFREGNGRAIRTFLAILANDCGWHIAWDEMNPNENIAASIAAYRGDEEPLCRMLENIVTPIDVFWGRDPYEFI